MSMLICFPAYLHYHAGSNCAWLKALAYSAVDSIKVLTGENIHKNISGEISCLIDPLNGIYKSYTAQFALYEVTVLIIQILAPFLTFGFVVSFIKNFIPGMVYKFFSLWRSVHIFSELDEKTVTLAKSIIDDAASKEKNCFKRWFFKPLAVFTGCERNEGDELIDTARELGAVIFRSEIDNIKFSVSKKRTLDTSDEGKSKKLRKNKKEKRLKQTVFYLTGGDDGAKIEYTSHIIDKYDYLGVSMYVFSNSARLQMMLRLCDNQYMQLYRVNDIQALVYHNLHDHGMRLFDKAHSENGNTISAVIVGLGKYGVEMLKALVWYCQVPGFKLKITAFDEDANAESKFSALCPELMSKNHDNTEGEAHYDINIIGGVDVRHADFYEKLKYIYDPTYIFVALGSDEDNISAAVKMRTEYKRLAPNLEPDIEAVVYNSNVTRKMSVSWDGENDRAEKGSEYNIHMIGSLEDFYSVKTVIASELMNAGREVNNRWSKTSTEIAEAEKKFWKDDYYYRSSIAKALHEALRVKLIEKEYIAPIKGAEKPWSELNDEEKLEIGMFEHVRWNAYMRSEGYRYAPKRNNLAKNHNNLVPVTALTDADLRKDA